MLPATDDGTDDDESVLLVPDLASVEAASLPQGEVSVAERRRLEMKRRKQRVQIVSIVFAVAALAALVVLVVIVAR